MNRLHGQSGGRATGNQFGDRETRREVETLWCVGRLEGPDPLAQPVDEGEVVRRSAEEGLAKMDVRLDKTGEEKLASPVDRLALEGESGTSVRRDRGDAPVFDPHIGVEDTVLRVTGEEARALNKDLLCRQGISSSDYGRSRVAPEKWAPTR